MPYRKTHSGVSWHWCQNCSAWPLSDFDQREDKPATWHGQALCEECATSDSCRTCLHSVELRVGLASDRALDAMPAT